MKFTSMAGTYLILLCSSVVSSRPTGDLAAALADDPAISIKEASGQLNLTELNRPTRLNQPTKGISYLAEKLNKAVVSRHHPIIATTPTKGIKYFAQDRNPLVEATLSERDFNLTDVERQRFGDVAESAKQAVAAKASSALGTVGIKYLAQTRNPAIGKMVRRYLGARDQPDAEVLEPRKLNITNVRHEGIKYLAQSKNAAVSGGMLLRRRLGSRHLPDAEVLEPRKLNITNVRHEGIKYLAQSKNAAVRAGKMIRRISVAGDQLDAEVLEPRKLNITNVRHEGIKYLAQTANAAVMSERRDASPEPVAQPEADPQPILDPDADLR
ncbi:MAG: hypothetical protein LQ350_005067 [Teloschistes chrysophthalmus]|nr:MAG: hypothetical protein LQ350_005067 [Niorma chrysophthalma]